jgi:hypothetical protein
LILRASLSTSVSDDATRQILVIILLIRRPVPGRWWLEMSLKSLVIPTLEELVEVQALETNLYTVFHIISHLYAEANLSDDIEKELLALQLQAARQPEGFSKEEAQKYVNDCMSCIVRTMQDLLVGPAGSPEVQGLHKWMAGFLAKMKEMNKAAVEADRATKREAAVAEEKSLKSRTPRGFRGTGRDLQPPGRPGRVSASLKMAEQAVDELTRPESSGEVQETDKMPPQQP